LITFSYVNTVTLEIVKNGHRCDVMSEM